MKCVYCNTNPVGKSDHVFPKSLGGENIYMDCVCDECNNKFSKIERELFQKSIIGLMRSAEGIEGYSKNKRRPAPLKFPEIFQHDKEEKVVYEIGIYNGFKPFMRPQIIRIKEKFYAEGGSIEEVKKFVDAFNKWRKENLVMVTHLAKDKSGKSSGVKYILSEGRFHNEKTEVNKIKKEILHYSLMKDAELKNDFEPRLFFDDSDNLIARSREPKEGIEFMNALLDYCNTEAAKFSSYKEKKIKEPISVSFKFNMEMAQQALVKIGLNSLMHYYPDTRYNPLLNAAKGFVNSGTEFPAAISDRMNFLDTSNDIHYVLFYQLQEGLLVRVSLFGSNFIHSFLVNDLNLFGRHGNFSGVEVNFRTKKQFHFSMDEFLLNRIQDMGWLNQQEEFLH